MTSSSKPTRSPDDSLTFEQALEQLEEIVVRIEGGESGLEKSIADYQRGMALVQRCKGILAVAEQRVEELSRQADAGTKQTKDGRNE